MQGQNRYKVGCREFSIVTYRVVVANLCVHVPIEVACAFSHGPLLELFRTLVINCAVERNISELLIIRRRRAEQHKTTCSAHSDSRIHCQVAYYGTQLPNENLRAFPNRMHTPRLRTRYLKQHRFSGAYLPTNEFRLMDGDCFVTIQEDAMATLQVPEGAAAQTPPGCRRRDRHAG